MIGRDVERVLGFFMPLDAPIRCICRSGPAADVMGKKYNTSFKEFCSAQIKNSQLFGDVSS
jgi:hypothetical protein